ncbi:MAG TPA: BON domain-containing protein [Actinomycetota bacterium]|nr:BON domain-containing protein [Actinomycetota bacterium]
MTEREPEQNDTYTAEHVREALARDERVNEPELDVQVVDGRVFVTGVVPTDERRSAVADVVRECCPHLEVENRTTIGRYGDNEVTERVR